MPNHKLLKQIVTRMTSVDAFLRCTAKDKTVDAALARAMKYLTIILTAARRIERSVLIIFAR